MCSCVVFTCRSIVFFHFVVCLIYTQTIATVDEFRLFTISISDDFRMVVNMAAGTVVSVDVERAVPAVVVVAWPSFVDACVVGSTVAGTGRTAGVACL